MLHKKFLWMTFLSIFYVSFTYSTYDFYQQCPAVSECPNESELKSEYQNFLSTYNKGTQEFKSKLLDLSQNYPQRLECFMSHFLEEHSLQCPTTPYLNESMTINRSLLTNWISRRIPEPPLNKFSKLTRSPSSPIDPICFHAGSLRGIEAVDQRYECLHYEQINRPRKFSCAEGNSTCKSNPTSGPCLSSSYSKKLAQVFEKIGECVGLNSSEQRNLFTIINHESAFMPNARSGGAARCMGQLTKITTKEITARLTAGLNNDHRDSYGLENVFERCPELEEHSIPRNIQDNLLPYVLQYNRGEVYTNTLNEINTDRNRPNHVTNKQTAPSQHRTVHYPMTCKLVSNPVSCLLYTSLYYKLLSTKFDKRFPPNSHLLSNTDREKFKNFVLKISYNGGGSFPHTFLRDFLKEIDCSSGSCSNTQFAEQLNQGEKLNLTEFSTQYIDYIFTEKSDSWLRGYKSTHDKQKRCNEVREYILKVSKHMDFLRNETEIQPQWNRQIGKPEAFDSFFQEVQNKCSSLDHEISLPREDKQEILNRPSLCDLSSST